MIEGETARELHPVSFSRDGGTITGIRDFRPRPTHVDAQGEDVGAPPAVVEPVGEPEPSEPPVVEPDPGGDGGSGDPVGDPGSGNGDQKNDASAKSEPKAVGKP